MIALLFGSFNPIHIGHISIAQYTMGKGLASEVWFVVSPQNPLKSPEMLAPFQHRLEMVQIATKGLDGISVCDIEATLPQPSYTINTLRKFHELFPDKSFTILAGSDIKEQLPQWREYREVERLAQFLIYPRGDNHSNCSPEMKDAPLIMVDSTSCRAELYPPSERVRSWLDAEIIEYINRNRLYKQMKTIEDYDKIISQNPNAIEALYERGQLHNQNSDHGKALNDFNGVLRIDPNHTEAKQMKSMIESIMAFRHIEIYNV